MGDFVKLRHVLALPVIGAVLVTGCSQAENGSETNTEPLPVADVNAVDPATLAPGGELRLAVDEFGSLNPMSTQSNAELAGLEQAFLPTFFRYDERGVAVPNPNFLESATETSTNPTRVTLKLNPRAVWGDGKAITAEDVVATWTACNGKSTGFRCSPDLRFDQIAEVVPGATPTEVELRFDKAYPQWRAIFDRVSVLRADSVRDPQVFNTGWAQPRAAWSSGPFVATDGGLEAKVLVTTPNQKWWGPTKPRLARLTIQEIPRENQVKSFTESAIDAVDIAGSREFFDAARAVPGTAIRRAGSPVSRQLVFNTASIGPVSELPVRQAIAVALDRSGVGTAALPGIGFTAAPLGNRIFLPGQQGYVDNAKELDFTRDLGKARDLLDGAGWREADGVRTRDGRPLEVRLVRIQGLATSENEARAMADQLAKVGIRVTIQDVSLADFDNGSVLAGGDFDMIVVGIDGGRTPLATLDNRFGAGAEQNWARFENPEIDTLIKQITDEPAMNKRLELADQLDRKLWEQMPTVPLYQLPQSVAVGVRVAGYGAPGLSSTVWENVGYAQP